MKTTDSFQAGFYEFFAGGGMARMGLSDGWNCLFANDFDPKKGQVYKYNFRGAPELHIGDVAQVQTEQLPGKAWLAWASFPCQDLSLAGFGAGLNGERSGTFWAFWNLMTKLQDEKRQPPIVVLENVAGLITSNSGSDFSNVICALAKGGYRVGALLVDAAYVVPQSRPRLFIIAFAKGHAVPKHLLDRVPHPSWHPQSLRDVVDALPPELAKSWVWWKLREPKKAPPHLIDIIESDSSSIEWHSPEETAKLLSMMTEANKLKVIEAQESGVTRVGTIYKRTRNSVQRAEVRFDGVSGCLRTPAGGSSRQIIMLVEGSRVRSRLITARETARLMGLPDSYTLPKSYNDAYHLTGDGVVVPVVEWLNAQILSQLKGSLCDKFNKRSLRV